jgi:hypothetical protein
MSSYYHPLVGGTMLASSVYHLFYYNGKVLGIRGIYSGAVAETLESIRRSFATAHSAKEGVAQSPSEADGLVSGNSPMATSNPKAQKGETNETGALRWKVFFVAGLLAGGALLRFLREPIESRLGIPIFETGLIQGTSATPLVSLLSGFLVGIGTKVIILRCEPDTKR